MNQIVIMILYSVISLLALPFGNAVVECTFSEMILIKHKLCWRMKDICLTQYPLHELFKGMKSAVVISGWPWSMHTCSDLENVNGSIKMITACGTLLGQSN